MIHKEKYLITSKIWKCKDKFDAGLIMINLNKHQGDNHERNYKIKKNLCQVMKFSDIADPKSKIKIETDHSSSFQWKKQQNT